MIIVNATGSGTDGQGNAITTSTLTAYGYDNATAGGDGAAVYISGSLSSSTDPAYQVLTDPCQQSNTDTLCSSDATCMSNTTTYPYVYQCQCNSGFNDTTASDATSPATDPSTLTQSGLVCTDYDECGVDGSVCGPGVDTCSLTSVGGYECDCTTGWEPSSDLLLCEDNDECADGTNTCSADATCANTDGGYSGDGFNCTDNDECADGTNTCSADATCANTDGSYNCTCNTGYSGDGFNCTDDDECTTGTDTCDANATCTNTAGSFTCACDTGYSGDGANCTDIDECAAGTDSCHSKADCTNTDGSYTCACKTGYSGDGINNCIDIDECATATDGCVNNATCTNNEGSYTCACNDGFIGDGTTTCIVAEPINYCYRAGILVNTTSTPTDALVQQAWEDFLTYYKTKDVTFFYANVVVTYVTSIGSNPTEIVANACFTNMTKTADELTTGFIDTYSYSDHGVVYDATVLNLAADIRDFDECVNNLDDNCYDANTAANEDAFYSAACVNTNGDYTCACNASLYDVNQNGTLCQDPYDYTCNGTFSTLTLYTDWFNGIGGNNWDVNYMTTTWEDADNIYAPVQVYTNTTGLKYITTSLIDFTCQCKQAKGQNITVGFGNSS